MGKISIVLGFQFGDEGKGSVVNWLTKQADNPLIIRFGGGSQCGHTVVDEGRRHVFSSIGSGALQGAPTYISKYCAINPIALRKEIETLGFVPKIYIDAEAMVIMPEDVEFDRHCNNKNTVGQGVGKTVLRNQKHRHLYFRDLKYHYIRRKKETSIINWYTDNKPIATYHDRSTIYDRAVNFIVDNCIIVNSFHDIKKHNNLIFEGHQGIMLDQHYGFFPWVTRSNTTSQNAIALIRDLNLQSFGTLSTYYVMRAYVTRHGAGPYPYPIDNTEDEIFKNPNETNIKNEYQGEFFKSYHHRDLLDYALDCDSYHNKHSWKNLVVTCLDQTDNEVLLNRQLISIENFNWASEKFDEIITSYSEEGPKINK